MTTGAVIGKPGATDAVGGNRRVGFWVRLSRRPVAVASAAFLLFIVFVACGAGFLMPHDPNVTALANANQGPSAVHLLGTDDLGRDVLSRVILGSRVSLIAAATAVIVAVLIGVPLGLVSGYFGGWVDGSIMRINDAIMSFPALMLAVTIVGILGPSLRNAMLAIGIVYAPRIMRIVRASALSIREENYVLSARAMGAGATRILLRHILPNLLSPLIVQVTVMFGTAILFEASLSFLGLGVQPPEPSWGRDPGPCLPLPEPHAADHHVRGHSAVGRDPGHQPAGRRTAGYAGAAAEGQRMNAKVVTRPTSQADRLLDIRDLSVSFAGLRVLDGINLHVDRDETVCLVGESGSGKSVVAMTSVGLTRYAGARVESGSIRFAGEELTQADNNRLNQLRGGEIGFIFQEPMTSLNPAFTIGNQIGEVLRLHLRLSRRSARQHAADLLNLVGVSDPPRRLDEYPHQLSGGMRQRVMIAIAIAANPKLLIADEPTTALDLTVQATILELLQRLREELKMAILLLITHDFGVVAEMADRIVVMYAGQVVESAQADNLFGRPRHPYTRGLLSSLPQLSTPGKRFESIPGTVPPPGGMPTGCRFHPRCPDAREGACTEISIPMHRSGFSDVRCVRTEELLEA